jgi:gliding-associated putative ABC transporter substrate-binding component GldG
MEMKKKINRQTTLINLAIFIAIIVVLNLISINYFYRLDFSKGKIYSLSASSKATMSKLQDTITVRAYFSRDLPPRATSIDRYTRDLLHEYQAASGGKLRFEVIEIKKDDFTRREEAMRAGVLPTRDQVIENDRIEIVEYYLGLTFHYQGRTATIPTIQERGLEYEITKTINRIASIGMSRVAFYSLEPELPDDPRLRFFMMQQDKFALAKEVISQNYELVMTRLEDPIPVDVETLLFSGAVDSLSVYQLYHLDQFLMRGSSIIFFQSRVEVNLQQQIAHPIQSNVFDILSHWGVGIHDNLVMDAVCSSINVREQRGIFTVNTPMLYPFFPIASDVNKDSPIVAQLENIHYLFVSEIDTLNVPDYVKFTPLVWTSGQSGSIVGPHFNIGIQQFSDRSYINRLSQGRKVITALYEGQFTSFFTGILPRPSDSFIPQTTLGKIIMVPDMQFISNQGAAHIPSNMDFLMNALDYLGDNQVLIALRSREIINKPLNIERFVDLSDMDHEQREKKLAQVRSMIKYLNIFIPGGLILLYGLVRYLYEVGRRKRIRATYE